MQNYQWYNHFLHLHTGWLTATVKSFDLVIMCQCCQNFIRRVLFLYIFYLLFDWNIYFGHLYQFCGVVKFAMCLKNVTSATIQQQRKEAILSKEQEACIIIQWEQGCEIWLIQLVSRFGHKLSDCLIKSDWRLNWG